MSFRLNFDLSFNFPPPPPRSHTPPLRGQDNERPRRGRPGWWQTARQHPHFALRMIYLVTAVIGFILDNVLLANFGYGYSVINILQTALAPVSLLYYPWFSFLLFLFAAWSSCVTDCGDSSLWASFGKSSYYVARVCSLVARFLIGLLLWSRQLVT